MAKIFRTKTQPTRSRLLLRIGLSIFLFLQIHVPQSAVPALKQFSKATGRHLSTGKKVNRKHHEAKTHTAGFCQEVAFCVKLQP